MSRSVGEADDVTGQLVYAVLTTPIAPAGLVRPRLRLPP